MYYEYTISKKEYTASVGLAASSLVGRVVSSSRCAKCAKPIKKLFFFFVYCFYWDCFLIFKFCEVLFESFRILGNRGGDVFCQFCIFCDRECVRVWSCDVFCQEFGLVQ